MEIKRFLILATTLALLSLTLSERTTLHQKWYYAGYDLTYDVHSLYFTNAADAAELNPLDTPTYWFSVTYQTSVAEVHSDFDTNNRDIPSDDFRKSLYRRFVPNMDGSSYQSEKHYVAFNVQDEGCDSQESPITHYFSLDIKFFDCAEDARLYYLKIMDQDNDVVAYRYDKDADDIVQFNGFVGIVPIYDLVHSRGHLSVCPEP